MAHKLINHVIENKRFFVYKIQKFSYRQRLFCFFDSDLPYRMSIVYKELNTTEELSPVFGSQGVMFQNKTNILLEKEYIFRMKTEKECKKHFEDIAKKKKIISNLLDNNKILDFQKFEKSIKEYN